MLVSDYTDRELLLAMQQNREEAFAELFKRYWKKVHTMAYARVRSEEVTQEIVQCVFVSLWEKRGTLSINDLPSYLYITVKNRVLNYLDSQLVRKKHWDYYKQFIPEHEEGTANGVEFHDLLEAIENAMDQLPEKSKKVFRLSRLEGHSIHEVAVMLNLSHKAAQYHLTRSLKKLRLRLRDYIPTGSAIKNSRQA